MKAACRRRPYAFALGPLRCSDMAEDTEPTGPDPIAVAIGSRVLQEREKLSITKEELSARSGLSSRYLWRVEVGRLNVQLRNLAKIADGLGLTVAQLTEGLEQLVNRPLDRPKPKRRGPKPRAKSAVTAEV